MEEKMEEKKVKISPTKGRPMLHWVGKHPLDYVKGFPAQLLEMFDPLNKRKVIETLNYDDLKDNWQNLLFFGDNKDVLATLIESGFRGKIDLIYIDPPFKSGADYVRRVELRGVKNSKRIEQDDASVLQQTMYFDMWNNDAYLQFMYERLLLLKELLSETGSIYVHLDWHVGPYIKVIMDEIFSEENFVNELIWRYEGPQSPSPIKFASKHDTILRYAKNFEQCEAGELYFYEKVAKEESHFEVDENGKYYYTLPKGDYTKESIESLEKENRVIFTKSGKIRIKYFVEEQGNYFLKLKKIPDVWTDIPSIGLAANSLENTNFATQKPEALLERIIKASSNPDDLVLDCFIGSGTTAAVAQKLGRRWIGCDINKGAVQLTSKRLQGIINEQITKNETKYPTFATYKVNNYDLKLLQTEAIELAVQYIGIQRMRTDRFFDGILGKNLVKIIDFNHPLTLLDLQLLQDELKKRPEEDRDITIVCLGKESTIDPWVEDWNKKHPINKISLIELKTDKKYGNFLIYKPAEAKVHIERKDNKAIIEIQNFISPTIIERLNIDSNIFKVTIPDFRSMIDCVLIDNNYDGKTFHTVYADVPEKKNDLVDGKYEIEIPSNKVKVAVKIIDLLGEEVVLVEEI